MSNDNVRRILNENLSQSAALDELLRVSHLQLEVLVDIRDMMKDRIEQERRTNELRSAIISNIRGSAPTRVLNDSGFPERLKKQIDKL